MRDTDGDARHLRIVLDTRYCASTTDTDIVEYINHIQQNAMSHDPMIQQSNSQLLQMLRTGQITILSEQSPMVVSVTCTQKRHSPTRSTCHQSISGLEYVGKKTKGTPFCQNGCTSKPITTPLLHLSQKSPRSPSLLRIRP